MNASEREDKQLILCDVCVHYGAKSCRGRAYCNFKRMTDDAQEEGIYKKYIILDAKTGREKAGKYYVLKINAKDPVERMAVREAMCEYARQIAKHGRRYYADLLLQWMQKGATDGKQERTGGAG